MQEMYGVLYWIGLKFRYEYGAQPQRVVECVGHSGTGVHLADLTTERHEIRRQLVKIAIDLGQCEKKAQNLDLSG